MHFVFVLFLAVCSDFTQGRLVYLSVFGVDSLSCGGTANAPCASLSYALTNIAHPGDVVQLAPGLYQEATSKPIVFSSNATHDVDIVSSTALANDTTIDRTFVGHLFLFEAGAGSVRFIGVRFINGGWTETDATADYAGGLMTFANGADGSVAFINCTFEHNKVAASGYSGRGGVGAIMAGAPRFVNCLFNDNWAGIAGVFHVAGNVTPVFQDCVFENSGCHGGGWGGAIVPEDFSAGLWQRCVFRNNTCYYGGAIDDGGSTTAKFVDCTFEDNHAPFAGGAYYGYGNSLTQFDGCVFRNNRVDKGSNGQDYYLASAVKIVIKNSIFEAGNKPQLASGASNGAAQDSSSLYMENCTVSGYHGAIDTISIGTDANATFESCLFSNNSGTRGGAVLGNRPISLRNCRFLYNSAIEGGAVYLGDARAFEYVVENCVFEGNRARASGGALQLGGRASARVFNCSFIENTVDNVGGGAIHIKPGAVLLAEGSKFVANQAPDGGAIWSAGNIAIKFSGFEHNNAKTLNLDLSDTCGVASGNGGAVYVMLSDQALYTVSNACLEGQAFFRNLTFVGNNGSGGGGAIFLDNDVPHCASTYEAVCLGCSYNTNAAAYGQDIATSVAMLAISDDQVANVWQLMEPNNVSIVGLDSLYQRLRGNHLPIVVQIQLMAMDTNQLPHTHIALIPNVSTALRFGVAQFPALQLQIEANTTNTIDTPLVLEFSSSSRSLSNSSLMTVKVPITLARCSLESGLVGTDGRCMSEVTSTTRKIVAASIVGAITGCTLAFLMFWGWRHPTRVLDAISRLFAGIIGGVAHLALQLLGGASDTITLVSLMTFDLDLNNLDILRALYAVCYIIAVLPTVYLIHETTTRLKRGWRRVQRADLPDQVHAFTVAAVSVKQRALRVATVHADAQRRHFRYVLARFLFGDLLLAITNFSIYYSNHDNPVFLHSSLRRAIELTLAFSVFNIGFKVRNLTEHALLHTQKNFGPVYPA
ncbi:TPA: hypothetical protein N0F65_009503 [Lagenidium giganteum]|uniref:Right handed beta helix domain-containing protein n=1 Tax=Lagenidium giganteum TaxID=4803 RepID=A0AAV2ZBD7_9STRA|nr:TPA: hypothetical protein N0F65_009503 [Lagenidium giganteum]